MTKALLLAIGLALWFTTAYVVIDWSSAGAGYERGVMDGRL